MKPKVLAIAVIPFFLGACAQSDEQPPVITTVYQTVEAPSPASTVASPTVTNKIIPVEALDSVWVPELCGNRAANLVGGKLPGSARTTSNQAALKRQGDGTPLGGYTDIDGDGRDEAVLTYVCDGGGAVGWPDNLLIYDNDLNYLTAFTGWKQVSGYEPARGHIMGINWDEDSVQVQWLGYTETDARCCASRKLLGDLTMVGGEPVMTLLTDIPVVR